MGRSSPTLHILSFDFDSEVDMATFVDKLRNAGIIPGKALLKESAPSMYIGTIKHYEVKW